MQAQRQELGTRVKAHVVGVAHDHAGCLEPWGGNTTQTTRLKQGANLVAQHLLLGMQLGIAVGTGLAHGHTKACQRVGRHGGVVHVGTALVGLHHLQPLAQVAGKAGAGCAVNALAGELTQHHQGRAGRAAPAFLRRRDQHINAASLHVNPDGAGGNAIKHKQATHLVHGITDGAQVIGRQDHARGGFHVGRKDHIGFFCQDVLDHFVDRAGRKGRLVGFALAARLEYYGLRGDGSHVENLCPAVAEPAVADYEAFFPGAKLAGHGFHAVAAAAGYHHGRLGVVDLFKSGGDLPHDALEALGHVVERAVGVDHRVLQKTIRVYVGQKSGHV